MKKRAGPSCPNKHNILTRLAFVPLERHPRRREASLRLMNSTCVYRLCARLVLNLLQNVHSCKHLNMLTTSSGSAYLMKLDFVDKMSYLLVKCSGLRLREVNSSSYGCNLLKINIVVSLLNIEFY